MQQQVCQNRGCDKSAWPFTQYLLMQHVVCAQRSERIWRAPMDTTLPWLHSPALVHSGTIAEVERGVEVVLSVQEIAISAPADFSTAGPGIVPAAILFARSRTLTDCPTGKASSDS